MCQIIAGQSAKIRSTLLDTKGLIADLYKSNSDGLGVMYATTKGLKIVKVVPKTIADVRKLIINLPQDDRNLTMHWRFATHGETDRLNCHPYTVVPNEVAMVHNGVLDTGNAADKSKSDTWHFIKDYLASAAEAHPDVVHAEGFVNLVGEFIGNNRFVFMTKDGRMTIVNKDQGLEHDGMWFANTYAWSPELLIPSYKPKYSYGAAGYGRGQMSHLMDDDDYYDTSWKGYYTSRGTAAPRTWSAPPAVLPLQRATVAYDRKFEDFVEAVFDSDAVEVAKMLRNWPVTSVEYIMARHTPTAVVALAGENAAALSTDEQAILIALVAAGVQGLSPARAEAALKALLDCSIKTPSKLADVMCYYANWNTIKATAPGTATNIMDVTRETIEAMREDEDDDGTGVWEHKGHEIIVTEEDGGVYSYGFTGPVGEDNGFGFMEAEDALDWACQEIDHLVDAAIQETSH